MAKKSNAKGRKNVIEKERRANLFEMVGMDATFYHERVRVDFDLDVSPEGKTHTPSLEAKTDEHGKEMSSFPTFNHDSKFFTSCFVNPYECEDSDGQLFAQHQVKVKQSSREIDVSEILVPKPSNKSHYCGVCRNSYDDYKDHIESEGHKRCISRSLFNKDIEQLANQFECGSRREGVVTRSAHKKSQLLMRSCRMQKSSMMSRKRKAQQSKRRQEEIELDMKKYNPMETTAKTHPIFSD